MCTLLQIRDVAEESLRTQQAAAAAARKDAERARAAAE